MTSQTAQWNDWLEWGKCGVALEDSLNAISPGVGEGIRSRKDK